MMVVSFFCQITPKRPLIRDYTDVLPAPEVGPNTEEIGWFGAV